MINTTPKPQTAVPPRKSRPSWETTRDRARMLVAEYLRDWGLKNPDVIAAESRRIVEQAEDLFVEGALPGHGRADLCQAAIRLANEEVEAAIASMANSCPRIQGRGSRTNGSIVPRLDSVLLEFPDAIRHRDRPPARLLSILERTVTPIIPECTYREMRPQPRTRLWCVLRRGYWHRVGKRLRAIGSRKRESHR